MRVFVFAYDRYETMTTPNMLTADAVEHTVLCHSADAAMRFDSAGTATLADIVITNNPKGLAYQRNSALDLMADDEWALFLVDDLKGVSELRNYDTCTLDKLPITTANQKDYAERFRKRIDMASFVRRAAETAAMADRVGARLGGFAYIDNALFRTRHWSHNTFCDGRAWVVKKSDLRVDTNVHCIEDMAWTAQNLQAFGATLVNQWVLPDCARYAAGGYGSIADRMPQKLAECRYLVDTYPSFVAFKAKAGHPDGGHVTLRPQPKTRKRQPSLPHSP